MLNVKKQCEIVENQAGNTIYRHDTKQKIKTSVCPDSITMHYDKKECGVE